MAEQLRSLLRQKGPDGTPNRSAIAQALVDKALSGNLEAIQMIFERIDGKVPDALVTDAQGELRIVVQYEDVGHSAASQAAPGADGGDTVTGEI